MNKMKKLILLVLVGLMLQSCTKQTSAKSFLKGLTQTSAGDIKLIGDNDLPPEDNDNLGLDFPDSNNLQKDKNNNYLVWVIPVGLPAIIMIAVMATRSCRVGTPPNSSDNNQAVDNQQEATQ
ncbi:hypothetical protein AGMMS49953_10300 [Endomicrobiia bacterium]|nr:hypothetical protein AGMMS49953_10300 [Endomicrobiia bacterium]